jgi:hypothetical protein
MFRKWTDSGQLAYTYKLNAVQAMGLASFAGIVSVRDGKITEVTTFNYVPVPRNDLYKFKTIDELFGIILSELPKAQVLRVQYDKEWHFPSTIWINYSQENSDADWYYEASDFQLAR